MYDTLFFHLVIKTSIYDVFYIFVYIETSLVWKNCLNYCICQEQNDSVIKDFFNKNSPNILHGRSNGGQEGTASKRKDGKETAKKEQAVQKWPEKTDSQ